MTLGCLGQRWNLINYKTQLREVIVDGLKRRAVHVPLLGSPVVRRMGTLTGLSDPQNVTVNIASAVSS